MDYSLLPKTIISTTLPPLFILFFSYLGYLIRNSRLITGKIPLVRTDEMVHGHNWILFSCINLLLLSRLCGEGKWSLVYIPQVYYSYFFTVSVLVLVFLWLFSLYYLQVLSRKGTKLRRRHWINVFGMIAVLALSYALSGI